MRGQKLQRKLIGWLFGWTVGRSLDLLSLLFPKPHSLQRQTFFLRTTNNGAEDKNKKSYYIFTFYGFLN